MAPVPLVSAFVFPRPLARGRQLDEVVPEPHVVRESRRAWRAVERARAQLPLARFRPRRARAGTADQRTPAPRGSLP